jgi:hypothetical protein
VDDELARIHCLQKGRLIHTGTAVLGNQTDFYKPPPLTEADMKFLRDLAALNKAQPLVRAHHEDLFPSIFVQRNRASLNNLPQTDELLDIDNTNAVEDRHTSALTWRRHYGSSVRGRQYLGVVPATRAYHSRRYAKLRCGTNAHILGGVGGHRSGNSKLRVPRSVKYTCLGKDASGPLHASLFTR